MNQPIKPFQVSACTIIPALLLIFGVIVTSCSSQKMATDKDQSDVQDKETIMTQEELAASGIPTIPRELRAVWVATVANIDWPSEPGLPVSRQKQELLDILNRAAAMNMNAVIFQVRPAADALYNSPHEPWSYFLTGKMGEAPDPYYDPLEFVVREAHKRGLELHAWFNPYRARHPADSSEVSADHISERHPELVHQFGDYQWLDPGLEEVQEHSHQVILDVVERYDIDGIHLDDYFYPYPSYASGKTFPDSLSWQRALEEGTAMSRDDWRRNNVDKLIRQLYTDIKEVKPEVKFGISPFGTWRPGHPEGTGGFDAYEQLYADAKLWLREGWVDYFTPQLYNRIDRVIRPFPVILQWWADQNINNRHMWAGLYTSRAVGDNSWPTEEITGQVYIARGFPGVTGAVHFSMQSLMDRNTLSARLTAGPYAMQALVPSSPWLDDEPPGPPDASLDINGQKMTVQLSADEEIRWWVLRMHTNDQWEFDIVPGTQRSVTFNGANGTAWPDTVIVSAVDPVGNESDGRILSQPIKRQTNPNESLSKPEMTDREDWGETPQGVPANAIRCNIAEGDTLYFRDLTIVLNEMSDGQDMATDSVSADTAHVTLHRFNTEEELTIAEGEALNWYGYHIGALAVNSESGVLGSGLTEFEIATVNSLPIPRAAAAETGGAAQRLRVPHVVRDITLHHSGSSKPLTDDEDPVDRLQNLYNWGAEERNWWDVPYHYLIGLDGTIFEGRDIRFAGETNTRYDTRGHLLISVIGNYDKQKPTPEQIEAIAEVMAWAVAKYNIPLERIHGHYDWADTSCPGKYIRNYLENNILQEKIENKLNHKNVNP